MDETNQQTANTLQQFLTPEAMLTPGVAGALTMMITNALASNFNAPRAWIGLLLSFVFGLLVLVSTKQLLVKSVFYILNSLVIFCVAAGANGLGASSQQAFNYLRINSAFAQENNKTVDGAKNNLEYCTNLSAIIEAAQKSGASNEQIVKLVQPCEAVSRDLLQGPGPKNDVGKSTSFFAPWRF